MTKPTVAIFGGGVAGMSAAHELAERGFAVAVYERQPVYVGGKARSTQVRGTAELVADAYLVQSTHTLLHPRPEAMLWDSPLYTPFSWAVVLTQIGYLGWLLQRALGRGGRWVSLAGLLEGAAMLLACLVAFTIAG